MTTQAKLEAILPRAKALFPGFILTAETPCIARPDWWRWQAQNATWRTMTTMAEVDAAYAERAAMNAIAAELEAA